MSLPFFEGGGGVGGGGVSLIPFHFHTKAEFYVNNTTGKKVVTATVSVACDDEGLSKQKFENRWKITYFSIYVGVDVVVWIT